MSQYIIHTDKPYVFPKGKYYIGDTKDTTIRYASGIWYINNSFMFAGSLYHGSLNNIYIDNENRKYNIKHNLLVCINYNDVDIEDIEDGGHIINFTEDFTCSYDGIYGIRIGHLMFRNEKDQDFKKKTMYIDMDGVLVDFNSGVKKVDQDTLIKYEGKYDEIPGIFSLMDPMPGAIESFNALCDMYDVYVLSTSPWNNEQAASDKHMWIKKYLPKAEKRLILSHHKNLCQGQYLIDDRTANGVSKFTGKHIHFGTEKWPNWQAVLEYLKNE